MSAKTVIRASWAAGPELKINKSSNALLLDVKYASGVKAGIADPAVGVER